MPGHFKSSLTARELTSVRSRLATTNTELARAYPGETGDRQPVHTVYGGAHLFKSDSASRLGAVAIAALNEYAADGATFGTVLGMPEGVDPAVIRSRVVAKLEREPVEDFRIDFEDGYGNRPDAEEDGHAGPRRRRSRRARPPGRCRRSSASGSSRCRRSCTRAACARSTSS